MRRGSSLVVEDEPVGSKKTPKNRARDEGAVVPLGVEIGAALSELVERCRKAKKWTKRTVVEEALRRYLTEEGFPPPPQP